MGRALTGGRLAGARNPAAERLASGVEQTTDPLVLPDADGVIVEWNPAATRLFDIPAEHARGRRLEAIAADLGATLPERSALKRALRGEVARYEPRRRLPDGRVRHLSITVSPVRDAE